MDFYYYGLNFNWLPSPGSYISQYMSCNIYTYSKGLGSKVRPVLSSTISMECYINYLFILKEKYGLLYKY